MPQYLFTNRLMEKALRRAFLDGVMEIYETLNQPRVYSITLEGSLSLLINKSEKYYIKIQETAERAQQSDPTLMPKLPNLTAQKIIGSIGSTSTITAPETNESSSTPPNDSLCHMLKSSFGNNPKVVVNVKTEPENISNTKFASNKATSPTTINTTKTPIMSFSPKILPRILPKPNVSTSAPGSVCTTTVTIVHPKTPILRPLCPQKCGDILSAAEFSLTKVKKEPLDGDTSSPSTSLDTNIKIKSEPTESDDKDKTVEDVMVVQPEWIEEISNHDLAGGTKRERNNDDEDEEDDSSAVDSVRKRIKASLKNPIMAINLPTQMKPKESFYFHKNIVECPLCKEPISNQTFLQLHLDRHRKDYIEECIVCKEGGQPLDVLLFHLTNFHTPGALKETDISKAKRPQLVLATTSGGDTRMKIDPSKMVQFMLDREHAKTSTHSTAEKKEKEKEKEKEKLKEMEKEKEKDKEQEKEMKNEEDSEGEFQIEYVCDECGDSFNSSKELYIHSKTAHGDNSGNYQCSSCSLNFENLYYFQDHMLEHHKEDEKCKCQMCGNEFLKWKDLKDHLMTAHRKYFTCQQCKVSFSDQQSLKEHIALHGHEKPDAYECDMCDKIFTSSKTYNAHRRSHIDVKPYVCHICQSAFFKRGDMAKHMRTIHEPTKLYMCKICGRTGTRADNMRVHVRTHKKEISREQVDSLLQKVDQ
ncbi:hypothetical protein SNE40_007966 [Patella caerulea]|uniref:C2H2-type domain-containing protein n=1 Tax=Patella caerulea TaxID=87958 RepID=A0AAN8PVW2_PATCE